MEELKFESSDFRVIDDPSWKLFGEIADTWTNSRERTNAEEDKLALSSNNLSGAEMQTPKSE